MDCSSFAADVAIAFNQVFDAGMYLGFLMLASGFFFGWLIFRK
jgi:hypothetical protein